MHGEGSFPAGGGGETFEGGDAFGEAGPQDGIPGEMAPGEEGQQDVGEGEKAESAEGGVKRGMSSAAWVVCAFGVRSWEALSSGALGDHLRQRFWCGAFEALASSALGDPFRPCALFSVEVGSRYP